MISPLGTPGISAPNGQESLEDFLVVIVEGFRVGAFVVGAFVVSVFVVVDLVVEAMVVGALVVDALVVGSLVVGALVVGALVVDALVVGALVEGLFVVTLVCDPVQSIEVGSTFFPFLFQEQPFFCSILLVKNSDILKFSSKFYILLSFQI